jgi:hypothetical protein
MEQDDLDLHDDDGYVSPSNPTVEDYRALEKKNRQLYARLKKKDAKPADAPAAPPKTEPAPEAKKESDDATWRERMELKTEGYSDEEIAYIQQSGGRKALENTYVKATIETMRKQKAAENAVVDTGGGKSEVEKKYTEQQLRDMPTADLEKLLPKA